MYILTDQEKLEIEQLWRRFNTFTIVEEQLTQNFVDFYGDVIFPKGTYRSEVWDYFDRIYPNGINKLINDN